MISAPAAGTKIKKRSIIGSASSSSKDDVASPTKKDKKEKREKIE